MRVILSIDDIPFDAYVRCVFTTQSTNGAAPSPLNASRIAPPAKSFRADAHTHIFCWGEDPRNGYLSERTRRSWLTRLLIATTGLRREVGENLSEKLRHRLLRQVEVSGLDAVIVLAQDAVYHSDGARDDSRSIAIGPRAGSSSRPKSPEWRLSAAIETRSAVPSNQKF